MTEKASVKKFWGLTVILLILLKFSLAQAVPVEVSFDPLDSAVYPGDTFSINLTADIPDPVLGFGLDLAFDPTILSLDWDNIVIGSQWIPAMALDGDKLAGMAFPLPVSGDDIVLAALSFTALNLGKTDLMASYTVGDFTEGFPLFPSGFADVVFVDGSVSVVPEPATWLLFCFGMLGMVGVKKRIWRG